MGQSHPIQEGTFHVTTNTKGDVPWLTIKGIPERLLLHLAWTKSLYNAQILAFCILPDHIHIILRMFEGRGMSRFVQSFKSNTSRDIREFLCTQPSSEPGLAAVQWQKGFHVHHLVEESELNNALSYVHYNAFRHGLVGDPLEWPWSSLQHPEIFDVHV